MTTAHDEQKTRRDFAELVLDRYVGICIDEHSDQATVEHRVEAMARAIDEAVVEASILPANFQKKKVSAPLSAQTQRVMRFIEKNGALQENKINQIVVANDKSCNMHAVSLNDVCIMMGNTWDFHPGCHGGDLPNFSSAKSLAGLLDAGLRKAGYPTVITHDDAWSYDNEVEKIQESVVKQNSWSMRTKKVMLFIEEKGCLLDNGTNQIKVYHDNSCEMQQVLINNTPIMTCNAWDFHPGRHGIDLPKFSTADGLAKVMATGLKQAGYNVEITTDDTWLFEDGLVKPGKSKANKAKV